MSKPKPYRATYHRNRNLKPVYYSDLQYTPWSNWRDHAKLSAIGFLIFVLLWQGKIAVNNFQPNLARPVIYAQTNLVTPLPLSSSLPSPVATTIPVSKWEEFKQAAVKVAEIYNYPVNVVLAQGALESSRGTSNFCVNRNNCLGVGAYDSDPDNAFTYENMEQAIVEYMRLIRSNFPEAWASRQDPDTMIFYIKYSPSNGWMYATDPAYIKKVKSMPEWSVK